MAAPAELDRRAREVLKALVQDYIQTGDPVASQALLARHELECSPATVRAVMSDLEALGLLEKPHASSGRIPTAHAYRIYVDTLLKVRPPTSADRDRITSLTADAPDVSRLLEGTADLLHSLSHHAAVVTTPRWSPPRRPGPIRSARWTSCGCGRTGCWRSSSRRPASSPTSWCSCRRMNVRAAWSP